MSGPDPIVTARLVLRRFNAHDAPALVALDSDPEVVRYAEPELVHAPRTLADVERSVLPGILDGYAAHPPAEWWAIAERAGGAFAGWVFLRPFDTAWELGYRLRRRCWNRGYATEACRAALEHGFCVLEVPAVAALVHPDNAASRRVALKLGLREVPWTDPDGDPDQRFEIAREAWTCG